MKKNNIHFFTCQQKQGFVFLPFTIVLIGGLFSWIMLLIDLNDTFSQKINSLSYLVEISALFHESPKQTLKAIRHNHQFRYIAPENQISSLNGNSVGQLCYQDKSWGNVCLPTVEVIRPNILIKNTEKNISNLQQPTLLKVLTQCQTSSKEL